jgi:hypothetical protein
MDIMRRHRISSHVHGCGCTFRQWEDNLRACIVTERAYSPLTGPGSFGGTTVTVGLAKLRTKVLAYASTMFVDP